MTVEDQLAAQEGLGLAVGRCLGLLYTDDGMVESRDTEWLQGALNVLIGLLLWYRMVSNAAKSKAMTFQTGTLQSEMLEEAVG